MPRPAPELRAYLEAVTGAPVSFECRLKTVELRLSLALRGRYHLEAVRLFGHELVLAVQSAGIEPATPAAYAAHVAAIRQYVEAPVALVLPGVTSTTRARLVAGGVPFIVPGSQMFLPMLLVDLRERMSRPVAPSEAPLGSVAQLVLLTHLQRQRLDTISLAQAASVLGYSPMMLTKAKDELVAAGLCTVRPEGRTLRLAFVAQGRALWEQALPRLSSPVLRTHLMRVAAPPADPAAVVWSVRAGISALSDVTELADDALVTWAASKATFAAARPTWEPVDLEEDADVRVEVWRHAPEILATNGRVDALSLFLSLRDIADERVREALEDLVETVPW